MHRPPFASSALRLACLASAFFLLSACALPGPGPSSEAEKLASLMVERLDWMDEVAAIKQARALPVSDPVREAELLRAMEELGTDAGVPRTAVRAFFRGQVAAAKQRQTEWLRDHRPSPRRRLPDLAKTVRPALDEIGANMIASLARLRAEEADATTVVQAAEQRLARAGYSATVKRPALDGLAASLKP